MTEHKGRCLCGKTTYTLTGDQATVAICHCTHCQKQTSSAFSIVVLAPRANFICEGPVKKFADRGDSGGAVDRWFCAECGSGIFADAAALPDTAIVKAGTFDDTHWLKPSMQLFCDSKQDWLVLPEGTANFGRMPG
jgi:hypothetical protein